MSDSWDQSACSAPPASLADWIIFIYDYVYAIEKGLASFLPPLIYGVHMQQTLALVVSVAFMNQIVLIYSDGLLPLWRIAVDWYFHKNGI